MDSGSGWNVQISAGPIDLTTFIGRFPGVFGVSNNRVTVISGEGYFFTDTISGITGGQIEQVEQE